MEAGIRRRLVRYLELFMASLGFASGLVQALVGAYLLDGENVFRMKIRSACTCYSAAGLFSWSSQRIMPRLGIYEESYCYRNFLP